MSSPNRDIVMSQVMSQYVGASACGGVGRHDMPGVDRQGCPAGSAVLCPDMVFLCNQPDGL